MILLVVSSATGGGADRGHDWEVVHLVCAGATHIVSRGSSRLAPMCVVGGCISMLAPSFNTGALDIYRLTAPLCVGVKQHWLLCWGGLVEMLGRNGNQATERLLMAREAGNDKT